MGYYYVPDAIDHFNAYEARRERESKKLPKCDCCEEPITDDYLFDLGDQILCETCLNDSFRRCTDSYIEED